MNYYSKIPPLDVVVENKKCKLHSSCNYFMPISGKNLPIEIDFSSCLPLSDVTIIGNIF